jgi:hypothetical protein
MFLRISCNILILLRRHKQIHINVAPVAAKGSDWQAVDEDCQIESELGLIFAVLQLPRDAEDVGCKAFCCLDVARRRRGEEQICENRTVLNAFSQDIHHSSLGYFSL